jgi:hypothetical protein
MKNKTLLIVTAALLAATANAQTLIVRTQARDASAPYSTLGLLLPSGWELWGFGLPNHRTADVQIGRVTPVNRNLLLGASLAYWPASKKSFVQPIGFYFGRAFGGDFKSQFATYVPLNGGPRIWFSEETRLDWHVGGIHLGVSGSYWQFEGSDAEIRVGPIVRFPITQGATGSVSCHPFYLSGKGDPTLRFEVTVR